MTTAHDDNGDDGDDDNGNGDDGIDDGDGDDADDDEGDDISNLCLQLFPRHPSPYTPFPQPDTYRELLEQGTPRDGRWTKKIYHLSPPSPFFNVEIRRQ